MPVVWLKSYKKDSPVAFLSLDCFRTLSFNFHNFEPTFELSFELSFVLELWFGAGNHVQFTANYPRIAYSSHFIETKIKIKYQI